MRQNEPMQQPEKAGCAELPDVEPLIGRERVAMGEDLTRARDLLRDGMSRLHDAFDALRGSVDAQTAALSKLREEALDSDTRTAAIDALLSGHQRLLEQSEAAMLGLQLEDILGQLLEFTRERADGISHVAATLAEALNKGSTVGAQSLHERLLAAVSDLNRIAEKRAVQQTSLATGEVELF